jgi:hypothetical protein
MDKTRNVYRILVGRLKGISHVGNLGVDNRIIGTVVAQSIFTASDTMTAPGSGKADPRDTTRIRKN